MGKYLVSALLALFIAVPAYATVGGGEITYKVKYAGDVIFSHDSHVNGRGLQCDVCHEAIFKMEHKPDKKMTMKDMRAKKACGVCHNGKNAFDVGSNCYICHIK